jgi:hypothetical protein
LGDRLKGQWDFNGLLAPAWPPPPNPPPADGSCAPPPPIDPGTSDHATLVADVLAGSNTLSYMGVAPGALMAVGHIANSGATDFAGGYDSSRAAIGWLRQYPGLIGLSTPPLIYTLSFGYLEYKQSLTNKAWSALQTVMGTGVPMTVTDANPATPTRFYRVRVQ